MRENISAQAEKSLPYSLSHVDTSSPLPFTYSYVDGNVGVGPETRKETLREGVRKGSKECTEARNVLCHEKGERWGGTSWVLGSGAGKDGRGSTKAKYV